MTFKRLDLLAFFNAAILSLSAAMSVGFVLALLDTHIIFLLAAFGFTASTVLVYTARRRPKSPLLALLAACLVIAIAPRIPQVSSISDDDNDSIASYRDRNPTSYDFGELNRIYFACAQEGGFSVFVKRNPGLTEKDACAMATAYIARRDKSE
jgi:hypothetical protein